MCVLDGNQPDELISSAFQTKTINYNDNDNDDYEIRPEMQPANNDAPFYYF